MTQVGADVAGSLPRRIPAEASHLELSSLAIEEGHQLFCSA